VRLHVSFNVLKDCAETITVTEGCRCERAVLKTQIKAGKFHLGDRNYGRDHQLLNLMEVKGCGSITRLLDQLKPTPEKQNPLYQDDWDPGVLEDCCMRLGTRPREGTLLRRRIELRGAEGQLTVLVTNQPPEVMGAATVAAIYMARWRNEVFFKWIKLVLGNPHFLADAPQGVAVQMYRALIAALLLQYLQSKRPTKRQTEWMQFYLMGWASLKELSQGLGLGKKTA